jgi:hypothetical protein
VKRRLTALLSIAVLAGGGCGSINNADEPAEPRAATEAATTPVATPGGTTDGTAGGKAGSVRDEGDIPDPCTLLTKAEVTSLTHRTITQIDQDGATAGDVTRFCQWQQEGGQLALFLSRTTAEEFKVTVAEAQSVDGVGEDAFAHSGHLYVLYGTVQIDVYSRGGSDAQNLSEEKKVAKAVIPKI